MILEKIAHATKKRISAAKDRMSFEDIKKRALMMPKGTFGFEQALKKQGVSLICEIKKASPSKGLIASRFPYTDIARAYEAGGAAAISVLTEPEYFLGSDSHLKEIKAVTQIPVLRKDFTVDAYQIYEAHCLGADAVLLICALHDADTIRRFLDICGELGICGLVEAHTASEVEDALKTGARIIGVNNRDLKTFEVRLDTCLKLRSLVPCDRLFVAESGISCSEDVAMLREAGVDAALVGEALMRSVDIAASLAQLQKGVEHE